MNGSVELLNEDFAFLVGSWRITHKRLEKRLEGSKTWSAFETEYECQCFMKGLANVDRLWGVLDGQYFEGVSVRTFDPHPGEWTIYWMDTRFPALKEQVRGQFDGDRGEFYGQTGFDGKKIAVRFLWFKISPREARWEQAYKHPETGEWETNWIMAFDRRHA